MSSEEKQSRLPDRLINPRILFYLLFLLFCLGLAWRFVRAALARWPEDAPPWLAVSAVLLGVAALFALRQEQPVAAEADEEPQETAVSPITRLMSTLLQSQLVQLLHKRRGWLALFGAAMTTILLLIRLPLMPADANYRPLVLLWLLGILFYLAAVAELIPALPSWRGWLQTHQQTVQWLSLLFVIALLLRLWAIDSIPFTLAGDEASQGLEAIKVLNEEIRNPFATGWLGVPTMSFFFNSLTIHTFGRTVLGLRLPWAFVGAATVLATFFLVRRLQGPRFAWITAVILATYHYHIHYSRLGSNQVADPFFLVLTLWLLYRALDNGRRLDWAATGVVMGLAFYFYAGARLTPVIVVAVLGYLFVRNPRQFWQSHRVGLLVMVGGFLIVAAPILQYGYRFPGEFNARLNQVGIIQSGWLEREVDIRQQSTAVILFDQFRRAALAFNYFPDRTVWYGLPTPLLGPLPGSLFLLGLLYGSLRLLGKTAAVRYAPMVVWWWGGMVLGGMMTESPPSSQRLITLAVPVSFFLALALSELSKIAQQALPRLSQKPLLIAGVLLFSLSSLNTYFVEYTPQRLYGGQHAQLATEIAPTLQTLSGNHMFYFVGAPFMYWGFATLPYLVPFAMAVDVPPATNPMDTFTQLQQTDIQKPGAVFIFLPQRVAELPLVAKAFPNGRRQDFFSPVNGQMMATLYIVSP